MKLLQVANILMQEIDGTRFKVEYNNIGVILWCHGVEPLESFYFVPHRADEYSEILKDALKFIKDNK